MAVDIIVAYSGEPINNKSVIASCSIRGNFTKKIIRENYPVDLTIESIESKYENRFFYDGLCVDGGDV